jgi:hypothetical protein
MQPITDRTVRPLILFAAISLMILTVFAVSRAGQADLSKATFYVA